MTNQERSTMLALLGVCSIVRTQDPGAEELVAKTFGITDEQRDRMAEEIARVRNAELGR